MERLSDRIVTSPGDPLGFVQVRVKAPGSELTYRTVGTVHREAQAGETFYAWQVGERNGTASRFTAAVLMAAKAIDRAGRL